MQNRDPSVPLMDQPCICLALSCIKCIKCRICKNKGSENVCPDYSALADSDDAMSCKFHVMWSSELSERKNDRFEGWDAVEGREVIRKMFRMSWISPSTKQKQRKDKIRENTNISFRFINVEICTSESCQSLRSIFYHTSILIFSAHIPCIPVTDG